MTRTDKLKAITALLSGMTVDNTLLELASPIPSWVVSEHNNDINKLKKSFPHLYIIERNGKFYSLEKLQSKKITNWFEYETE